MRKLSLYSVHYQNIDDNLTALNEITILDLVLNRIEDLLIEKNLYHQLDEIEYRFRMGYETNTQSIVLYILHEDYSHNSGHAINCNIHPKYNERTIREATHKLDMEIHQHVLKHSIPKLQNQRYKQLLKSRRLLSRWFKKIPVRFEVKTIQEANRILNVINIISKKYDPDELRTSSDIIKQDNSHGKSKKKFFLSINKLKSDIKSICEKNLNYKNKQKQLYITNAIIKTLLNPRRYLR